MRPNEEQTQAPRRAPKTIEGLYDLVGRLRALVVFLACVASILIVVCGGLGYLVQRQNGQLDNIGHATALANKAIAGQVITSERTECRARISSEYTSRQWSDLAQILVKAFAGDRVGGEANARAMEQRASIDDQVDDVCPSPIADAPTTTTQP